MTNNKPQNTLIDKRRKRTIGIIDADLLDNGTRHPNLVLMKLAGYLRDKKIKYELIHEESLDINSYKHIYVSKVFTFTNEPEFLKSFKSKKNIHRGGTGYYADEENIHSYNILRANDMSALENDPLLPNFSMRHQMPDYTLYETYIEKQIKKGKSSSRYKDYRNFSIGFLTRGCFRKCVFCVNRNIDHVYDYSDIKDFVDPSRKYIYLWDDNILASKKWRTHLEALNATQKKFQFRQGIDIRLITDEKARILAGSNYYGDYIFAFDHWEDKELIERKLKIWKQHCTQKTTKLYLFCGYELKEGDDQMLFNDVLILFKRIEVLMKHGSIGYVMRHSDYKNHRLGNIYTQIARWCNQPQFYKKMSFKEFVDRNQTYQEEHSNSKAICKSVRTYNEFQELFKNHWNEIEPYFTMKYENTIELQYK